MLTGRAKASSSFCPQAVTHRSTNRARRRVTFVSAETRYQRRHAINASTVALPYNFVSQPEINRKIH